MVLAAPERWRLRARRGRRSERLHGGEHFPDEPFGRPAQQADGAARLADPYQFVRAGLVVRRKHHAQAGHHHVELVVLERECLGVPLLPVQLNAAIGCLPAAGVEHFRREVTGDDVRVHHGGGDRRVAGTGGHVQDALAGLDGAGVHEDGAEVCDQFAGEGGVVALSPHGTVLFLQCPVRLGCFGLVIHGGTPLL